MKLSELRAKWNRVYQETGYRSGYEAEVAANLSSEDALYEPTMLPYPVTIMSNYKPDFVLPHQCIVIEAKGRFTKADRDKMLRVKQQYPELDIRMLFQHKEKITSRMTALDWCEKYGFPAAVGTTVPEEWLKKIPTEMEEMVFQTTFFKRSTKK